MQDRLAEYATLKRQADDGNTISAHELTDVSYTLCVVTGTRQLDAALSVARQQLAEHAADDTHKPQH